jgi:hypothetical protein
MIPSLFGLAARAVQKRQEAEAADLDQAERRALEVLGDVLRASLQGNAQVSAKCQNDELHVDVRGNGALVRVVIPFRTGAAA